MSSMRERLGRGPTMEEREALGRLHELFTDVMNGEEEDEIDVNGPELIEALERVLTLDSTYSFLEADGRKTFQNILAKGNDSFNSVNEAKAEQEDTVADNLSDEMDELMRQRSHLVQQDRERLQKEANDLTKSESDQQNIDRTALKNKLELCDKSNRLVSDARAAREQGNLRSAADLFLKAALIDVQEWEVRWQSLVAYGAILRDHEDGEPILMPSDKQAMRRMHKDISLPYSFRVYALYIIAVIYQLRNETQRAANVLHDIQDMLRHASSNLNTGSGNPLDLDLEEMRIHQVSIGVKANLHKKLQSPFHARRVHHVPCALDDALVDRLIAGGGKCDCCQKSRDEAEGGLMQCSRCKMAYYCSSNCQSRAWKSGHKKACRSHNQIEVDDYMVLRGIESRPELNHALVRVVAPSKNRPGRWDVLVLYRYESFSVSAEKLAHIRPAN